MKFKLNLRRELKIVAVLIVLFALIAFTERMKGDVAVSQIEISIENVHDNHYLDENDVLKLMQLDLNNLRGADLSQLNFSQVEARIRQSPYVDDAELFSDLKGNIMVNVSLRRPIARMIQSDGPDAYIGEDGTVMPVSQKFISRVVLVSGDFVPRFLKTDKVQELEEGRKLMNMLNALRDDVFWSAQIAQIDINARGEAVLFPQLGDEKIEFGTPDQLETKFRKLKIFYKEVLPTVGWNKYDRINVEYEGQVVAE